MAMVLGALLKALMAMYPSVAAVFTSLWNRLMDWEYPVMGLGSVLIA